MSMNQIVKPVPELNLKNIQQHLELHFVNIDKERKFNSDYDEFQDNYDEWNDSRQAIYDFEKVLEYIKYLEGNILPD